ncbi:MAG: hypothetical protein KDA58_12610, partial [Planctomycetaceae bacterium]|nr:hypothetical protein [Planctomycetaceae bacterium]
LDVGAANANFKQGLLNAEAAAYADLATSTQLPWAQFKADEAAAKAGAFTDVRSQYDADLATFAAAERQAATDLKTQYVTSMADPVTGVLQAERDRRQQDSWVPRWGWGRGGLIDCFVFACGCEQSSDARAACAPGTLRRAYVGPPAQSPDIPIPPVSAICYSAVTGQSADAHERLPSMTICIHSLGRKESRRARTRTHSSSQASVS